LAPEDSKNKWIDKWTDICKKTAASIDQEQLIEAASTLPPPRDRSMSPATNRSAVACCGYAKSLRLKQKVPIAERPGEPFLAIAGWPATLRIMRWDMWWKTTFDRDDLILAIAAAISAVGISLAFI
jgi:hypothetical protein